MLIAEKVLAPESVMEISLFAADLNANYSNYVSGSMIASVMDK
jgi:hypothetical protein